MKIIKIKALVFLLASLPILGGCAEFYALKSAVGSYGSEAADETLGTAVWTICSAVSVGAIERRFQTDEQRQAREVICEIPKGL